MRGLGHCRAAVLPSALHPPPSSSLLLCDLKQVQPPAIGAQHLEHEIVEADALAALGHAAEARQEQAPDGVEFLLAVAGAESPVEVGELSERLDPELAPLLGDDVVLDVLVVVLVLDVSDDLLD